MKSRPLVSVVVNFYNQAHLVPRALRSVVNQTYQNLDIIVVDDGSKDDVETAVKRVADPRVRFFRQKNGGVATARNLGVREAKGKYISFLDGDDVFLPQKIEILMGKLIELGEMVIASGCYFVTKRGFVIGRRICGKFKTVPSDPISGFPKINPSLLIYDRRVFDELGGFPEAFRTGEDGMFNRMVLRKYAVISLPQPLVLKEKDDETSKSRRIFLSYEDTFNSFVQKRSYVEAGLSEKDYNFYNDKTRTMHLCGFLAMGNMAAAKRWFKEVCESQIPVTGARIVKLSVVTGFNFYRVALRLQDAVNFLRYLPATVSCRKIWSI